MLAPRTYDNPVYAYIAPPELQRAKRRDGERPYPVVVVGAGPVGLSAAVDLALHGVPVVLLDDGDSVSVGSRAICFAKRSLEIFDRLGCGQRMLDRGVVWNLGKVFFRDKQIYSFDLLPEQGHKYPAFINLQQYYVEQYLVERAQDLRVDLRWKNAVVGVEPHADRVALEVRTPDGDYALECRYLIAADGARSPVRRSLGLTSKGQVFQDKFLIADIVMKADFPTERWFWFDPPFHRGQSALLHKQPDNVWRLDFQLGWQSDAERERQPENVLPRVKAMLGDIDFDLEWCSVYTFACRRMDKFRHARVLFVGDAAHLVSPFGARGCNAGVQDTDNLVWKLKLVLDGRAPQTLLDSYDAERIPAADENIMNSTRSTDFITPKNEASRLFRDTVLELAEHYPFARALVNSGRLSVPYVAADSPLNTPDEDEFSAATIPGAPCVDAPLADGWLLERLGGAFTGLLFGGASDAGLAPLSGDAVPVRTLLLPCADHPAAQRYDARPGTFYLIRPDQHVAARWRRADIGKIRAAVARATGAA